MLDKCVLDRCVLDKCVLDSEDCMCWTGVCWTGEMVCVGCNLLSVYCEGWAGELASLVYLGATLGIAAELWLSLGFSLSLSNLIQPECFTSVGLTNIRADAISSIRTAPVIEITD